MSELEEWSKEIKPAKTWPGILYEDKSEEFLNTKNSEDDFHESFFDQDK